MCVCVCVCDDDYDDDKTVQSGVHCSFQNKSVLGRFVSKNLPSVLMLVHIQANEIPLHVYKKASEVGMLQAAVGWPEVAGPRPEGFDGFFSVCCMHYPSQIPFTFIFMRLCMHLHS